jgi:hypothetical protein
MKTGTAGEEKCHAEGLTSGDITKGLGEDDSETKRVDCFSTHKEWKILRKKNRQAASKR